MGIGRRAEEIEAAEEAQDQDCFDFEFPSPCFFDAEVGQRLSVTHSRVVYDEWTGAFSHPDCF